jgi:hypothetical protein
MEETMETHLDHEPVATGWSWVAAITVLVTLLAGPIAVVTSRANPPPRDALAMTQATSVAEPNGVTPPASYSVPADVGDIGHFAFGYVEFDRDPQAPGGVPGFDSWPPGSPRR